MVKNDDFLVRLGRVKDFRCIATRYSRNTANFLAIVCIAATISDWL